MEQPICDFGWKAPDFSLRGTDGKTYTLDDVRGPKGTVVMFICNHCPYVKAIQDRLVRDFTELADAGVGAIAIMTNDPTEYPEDSFENMKGVAAGKGYPFPYVIDETQAVGRAYDARCTPDFFGFNAGLELQYRGRLDSSRNTPGPVGRQARARRRDETYRRNRHGTRGPDRERRVLDQVAQGRGAGRVRRAAA